MKFEPRKESVNERIVYLNVVRPKNDKVTMKSFKLAIPKDFKNMEIFNIKCEHILDYNRSLLNRMNLWFMREVVKSINATNILDDETINVIQYTIPEEDDYPYEKRMSGYYNKLLTDDTKHNIDVLYPKARTSEDYIVLSEVDIRIYTIHNINEEVTKLDISPIIRPNVNSITLSESFNKYGLLGTLKVLASAINTNNTLIVIDHSLINLAERNNGVHVIIRHLLETVINHKNGEKVLLSNFNKYVELRDIETNEDYTISYSEFLNNMEHYIDTSCSLTISLNVYGIIVDLISTDTYTYSSVDDYVLEKEYRNLTFFDEEIKRIERLKYKEIYKDPLILSEIDKLMKNK